MKLPHSAFAYGGQPLQVEFAIIGPKTARITRLWWQRFAEVFHD